MEMLRIRGLSPKRRQFLCGTLLLTGTGFLCRILGFFYRICLSRTIGAEGLGLYHLMQPVFGICFALCAGSVQTALSQHIAAHAARGRNIFRAGLTLSLGLACALGLSICLGADVLARYVLLEPRCAPFLPFLGVSVPFAALHACVNGYYYGIQRSSVPAFSQIVEQCLRMIFVFTCAQLTLSLGKPLTVKLAAAGHLAGEVAAAGFSLLCLAADARQRSGNGKRILLPEEAPEGRVDGAYIKPLLALAAPLMGNRLILNLLAFAEAVLIPACLQKSGLSSADALSVYGVLTGMALPFVLFPSAVANSMAVLLLPDMARAQAEGRRGSIRAGITLSLRYSLSMGILCIGIFLIFGDALGQNVFHNESAGSFIRVLAWLCPFLYLATTLGSILNGLGRMRVTFLHHTAAMALRLGFVLLGVPRFGIRACLAGMLAGEILLSALHLVSLKRIAPFSWDAADLIVRPAALLMISVGVLRFLTGLAGRMAACRTLQSMLPAPLRLPDAALLSAPASGPAAFLFTAAQIGTLAAVYAALLLLQTRRKRTHKNG